MEKSTWILRNIEKFIKGLERILGGKRKTQLLLIILTLFSFCLIFRSLKVSIAIMIAVLIHELGHVLAIKIIYKKIKCSIFFIPVIGAATLAEVKDPPSKNQGICISLAGPLTGIIVTILVCIVTLFSARNNFIEIFINVSFLLNISSLLPLPSLDGGRAISYFLKESKSRIIKSAVVTIFILVYTFAIMIVISSLLKNFFYLLSEIYIR